MDVPDFLFETDRLRVRLWLESDVSDAFQIFGDARVQRTLRDDGKKVKNLQEMSSVLADRIEKQDSRTRTAGNWAVVHKETRKVIGCIIFQPIVDDSGRPTKEVDVTWAFAAKEWGKGYATEAAAGAIQYCLSKQSGIERFVARCRADHEASQKVAKRIGMNFAGHVQVCGASMIAVYEFVNAALDVLI